MVTGAYLLLAIGGILYLCGWVMLMVLAFKKSLGWGLVILLLSWLIVPLIVFLIKYWDEARIGFMIMVGGLVVSGVGGFILVGSVATSAMAEFESFDLPQPEVAQQPVDEPPPAYLREPTEAEVESAPPEEPPTDEEPVVSPDEEDRPPPAGTVLGERVEWQPLANMSDLGAFKGELIELRMTDGTQLRVTLEAIEGGILKVTQRVGGGAMGYSVSLDLVDEVWVVK